MKKIITFLLSCIFVLTPVISGCSCNNNGYTTIEINEVTHSVFYAPLYVAIENGYFDEQKIKINLTNGGGADKSMTALLSKSADIGLMGPETVIYIYKNKVDSPKVFAQLTQKDGAFLVSRVAEPNFSWENLRGKEILAGRRGGMPAMNFEYVLMEKGLEIDTDYTLNFDVQFNLMTASFLAGTGDYCTVFEPTASEYERQGRWHIVASIGDSGDCIPYTSFIALSSYINNNRETIKNFLLAIQKAHKFMSENTALNIANAIKKQFPSTDVSLLEASIKSYQKINAWKTDFITTTQSLDRLQDVMINAGELTTKATYNDICDMSIAREIAN